MRCCFFIAVFLFFLPAGSFSQSPPSRCNGENAVEDCLSGVGDVRSSTATSYPLSAGDAFGHSPVLSQSFEGAESGRVIRELSGGTSSEGEKQGFHWGRALSESFTFLAIEQAYVVHTDFRWVVAENGIPFNHYWRDYMQSLSAWKDSGWSDGDPNWFGYIGHPIQGALTSFIQIQNDPEGERVEFSNTKAYWRSRLKATLWNAVYSTQWNLGPISEVTVEKYGTKERSPWNRNGSWPCTSKNCFTGVGQIDIVMTPIGGLGWLIGEDLMDKHIARRVERTTRNRFLIDTVRCTVNPIRGGANILHGNRPWFRARDTGDWNSVDGRH